MVMNILRTIFLVVYYCVGLTSSESFPEDRLIGPAPFTDGSTSFLKSQYLYLLASEGAFRNYGISDGYMLGFQWNAGTSVQQSHVNFQIYRKNVSESVTGSFQLMAETGYIASTADTNVLYMNEALRVTGQAMHDYYIAIVQYPNDPLPVLQKPCLTSQGALVLGTSQSPPALSEFIELTSVLSRCLTFSVQAIFLPTYYAGEPCSFHYVQNQFDLVSNEVRYNSHPSGYTQCWILRAGTPDLVLKLAVVDIDLEHSSDCYKENLEIGQFMSSFADYAQVHRWCGQEVSPEWYSDMPYVKVTLRTDTSTTDSSFHIVVTSSTKPSDDGGGGTPVYAYVIPVVAGCVIVFCTIQHRHKKRQEAQARANQAAAQAQQRANPEREKTPLEKAQEEANKACEEAEKAKKASEEADRKAKEAKEKAQKLQREADQAKEKSQQAQQKAEEAKEKAARLVREEELAGQGASAAMNTVSTGSIEMNQDQVDTSRNKQTSPQTLQVTVEQVGHDLQEDQLRPHGFYPPIQSDMSNMLEAPPSYESVLLEDRVRTGDTDNVPYLTQLSASKA